jgi:NAD(P)-dependent dehydrogenase (short-subunit alcohol dehydrogenase family)
VLVTGASRGIGREAAGALAAMGADIVLVCRDRSRGEDAANDVRSRGGGGAVDLVLGDLSSMRDVRRVARDVASRFDALHVLVNNAGAIELTRSITADGYERTFATNHLAYFLLTNELLPLLEASAPARVVNVASVAHKAGKIVWHDLHGARKFSGSKAYAQSKLANVMFTYALARRLDARRVTVNALHPGAVASSFGQNTSSWLKWLMTIGGPFLKSPARGAKNTVYLASSPAASATTGKYFVGTRPTRSSRASMDEAAQEKLWRVSEDLTAITNTADTP